MKPGLKTTEFWVTAFVVLAGSAAAIYAFKYAESLHAHFAGMLSISLAFAKAHGYNAGRVQEKIQFWLNSSKTSEPTPAPAPSPPTTPAPASAPPAPPAPPAPV